MCGFAGVIHQDGSKSNLQDIKEMNQIITHRGPDDEGYFENEDITVGFRRLSIIDLSHGAQPLSYGNGKFWVVFNGEIYNYKELKQQLQETGYEFRTDSDTEVLLAMYAEYGEKLVQYLRGMFAFVIWNTETHEVFGARDQFGIKPLYYADVNENIYFASEKKAINQLIQDQRINDEALQDYMTFQYVPEPFTLTPSICRIPAGHCFTKKKNKKIDFRCYYKPTFSPQSDSLGEKHVTNEITKVLRDSVQKHMQADVTVGSFLSGGIDSSIVVALAKEVSPNIKTFSVGFERTGYSEIDLAKENATELGVENISEVITPDSFVKEFPKFVYATDDPLADPAAVPHYFLAKLASRYCKVALTGEGADEMFGGYAIYNEPNSLKIFEHLPNIMQGWLNHLANVIPEGIKGRSFLKRGTMSIEKRFIGNAKIFSENEKKQLLKKYDSSFPYTNVTKKLYQENKRLDDITRMKDIDMNTWLIGDLLVNADRTTMASSLELRTPFIDREVFEIARKIPTNLEITHNTTKYILREAAKDFVPKNVLFRPKLGFPVPIRHWLKNELADWAKNLIKQTHANEYIDSSYALKLLEDHQANKRDNSRKLWTILTFLTWYQVYIERKYTDIIE